MTRDRAYQPIALLAALFAAMTFVLPTTTLADDKKEAADEAAPAEVTPDSISYFLGISVGQQMAQNGFKLDDIRKEAFMSGFGDGVQRKDASLSDAELNATQKAIQTLLAKRGKEMMEEMKKPGLKYLAENKDKEGVQVTESGLQYKVVEAGSGESPSAEDTVKVHYTGTLIDGKTFDSSRKRGEPATFRVSQVIPGWQEGLQLMKTGSRFMFYVPSELAYGERGSRGAIGPNQVLVFDVELLEIK